MEWVNSYATLLQSICLIILAIYVRKQQIWLVENQSKTLEKINEKIIELQLKIKDLEKKQWNGN